MKKFCIVVFFLAVCFGLIKTFYGALSFEVPEYADKMPVIIPKGGDTLLPTPTPDGPDGTYNVPEVTPWIPELRVSPLTQGAMRYVLYIKDAKRDVWIAATRKDLKAIGRGKLDAMMYPMNAIPVNK